MNHIFLRHSFNFSAAYGSGITKCARMYLVKDYSVYPPTFLDPVFHPDQVKKLSPEEREERLHQNIKPPLTNQNASPFYDPLLQKLVNHVMKGGQKSKAREIIEETFLKIKKAQVRKFHLEKDSEKKKDILTNPLEIFHQAHKNCTPLLDVTPVKKGGAIYKVPVAISDQRASFLAFKWIIESAREHPRRTCHTGEYFSDRLAKELMDASASSGKSWKKKVELHKVCEANKAYAHYRWTK